MVTPATISVRCVLPRDEMPKYRSMTPWVPKSDSAAPTSTVGCTGVSLMSLLLYQHAETARSEPSSGCLVSSWDLLATSWGRMTRDACRYVRIETIARVSRRTTRGVVDPVTCALP
ncbi:hypothetical protein BCEP4_710017 [Burkholderia cepacia]|nr:hypothetical protein BCEP4_710017 [Burkholderia cepacia]